MTQKEKKIILNHLNELRGIECEHEEQVKLYVAYEIMKQLALDLGIAKDEIK